MEVNWYVLGAIALLTLCSVLTRAAYMVFGHLLPLPESLRRALRYAPAAALVAIIVPEILPWSAGSVPQIDVRAAAAVVAIALYVRTGNSLVLIGGGMLAYWLMRPWWPF